MRPPLLLALLLLLGLAGCGGDSDAASDEPASFEDVPWALVSGISLTGGATPGATFVNGTVGGSAGCNHFTAPYTVDGDEMEIGTVASTQMACQPPVQAVETAYLAALGEVAAWKMDGEQLVLSDGDGKELLRYDTPSFEGDYEATAIRTADAFASPLPGTTITAKFFNGEITGSAGCNTYGTSYTTDRGTITIEPPHATRKLCTEPAGVMEQEAAYLAALEAADHFRLDGPSALALMAADGTYLVSFAER